MVSSTTGTILKLAFSLSAMTLSGNVTTGLGNGAYYIGMEEYQERFYDVLGFHPFPGTLNLEVDTEQRTLFEAVINPDHIDAPIVDGSRLSDVAVFPVTIQNQNGSDIDGALLRLEKTDHPDSIAEIVSRVNLRETLNVEDGDTVIVAPR